MAATMNSVLLVRKGVDQEHTAKGGVVTGETSAPPMQRPRPATIRSLRHEARPRRAPGGIQKVGEQDAQVEDHDQKFNGEQWGSSRRRNQWAGAAATAGAPPPPWEEFEVRTLPTSAALRRIRSTRHVGRHAERMRGTRTKSGNASRSRMEHRRRRFPRRGRGRPGECRATCRCRRSGVRQSGRDDKTRKGGPDSNITASSPAKLAKPGTPVPRASPPQDRSINGIRRIIPPIRSRSKCPVSR